MGCSRKETEGEGRGTPSKCNLRTQPKCSEFVSLRADAEAGLSFFEGATWSPSPVVFYAVSFAFPPESPLAQINVKVVHDALLIRTKRRSQQRNRSLEFGAKLVASRTEREKGKLTHGRLDGRTTGARRGEGGGRLEENQKATSVGCEGIGR